MKEPNPRADLEKIVRGYFPKKVDTTATPGPSATTATAGIGGFVTGFVVGFLKGRRRRRRRAKKST